MIGQISSTLITATAIIIVARFLGSTNYGQITIAMIPISIAGLFIDLGINGALIKYLAQYRSEGRIWEANSFLKAGLTINILAGSILTALIFISSEYLAKQVFHQPEIQVLIQISSLNLLALSLLNTARSIFIGYERMKLVSLMVIIQSIIKSVLSPLLVFFGYGALGAATGHTAAILVTGIVGVTIIQFTYLKQRTEITSTINFIKASKTLLSYGAPLFLSLIINGSIMQIYNFLMALNVTPSEVGNYQAATNFPVLIAFFTLPIVTVLFPLFSKIPRSDNGQLASVYRNAVKYSALIIVPVTSVLILLSDTIVQIIYGSSYVHTFNYLKLVCVPFLLIGLGYQINGNLLNGQGKTRPPFISSIVVFLVGLPLSLLPNPTDGHNRPPYHHDNSYPCRAIVHTVLDTPKLRFLIRLAGFSEDLSLISHRIHPSISHPTLNETTRLASTPLRRRNIRRDIPGNDHSLENAHNPRRARPETNPRIHGASQAPLQLFPYYR